MSYNFYVVDGKKFINYKPSEEHYERALIRCFGSCSDGENMLNDKDGKLLFLLIKMIGKNKKSIRNAKSEEVEIMFTFIEIVENIVSRKTPRQFMKFFPLDKEYDGGGCWKDYYWCIDYINKIGIDKPLGGNAAEFLMNYQNIDVTLYALTMMETISAMSIIRMGTDPLNEFFEEVGLHPKTMYKDENYMIDAETGERFEIKTPQKTIKKLFSVVS